MDFYWPPPRLRQNHPLMGAIWAEGSDDRALPLLPEGQTQGGRAFAVIVREIFVDFVLHQQVLQDLQGL